MFYFWLHKVVLVNFSFKYDKTEDNVYKVVLVLVNFKRYFANLSGVFLNRI